MIPDLPNRQCQSDILDPARAAALQIALGRPADITHGTALPPFFHQLYFWAPEPPGTLGRDGHPRVGAGLIPDFGLPRRMWADGRLTFHAPLIAGVEALKTSVAERVRHKQGRSGPLAFVTLRHDVHQNDILCLSEWQDVVYRPDPDPQTVPAEVPRARQDHSDVQAVQVNSTLLFRYSALSFNGHRIHYDQDYARDVEGYAGLVVHGPLLAQMLMLMAVDLAGPLAAFEFRAISPLTHMEPASLCRNGRDFWVKGPKGRLVMTATATPVE